MNDWWDKYPDADAEKQLSNWWDKYPDADQGGQGVMPFVSQGIAEGLGTPADLLAGGLNLIPGASRGTFSDPFLGSKSIKNAMEFYGINLPKDDRSPQTTGEYVGRGVGEAAAAMVQGGALLKLLSKGAGLTGSIVSNINKAMVKNPATAMISEVGGGAGFGAGQKMTEEGGELSRNVGPLVTGIAGAMSPNLISNVGSIVAMRYGKNILRKVSVPFTEKGAQYRAGKYAKSLVSDPKATAEQLAKDIPGDLPPAVASGEKRLVELYKNLVMQDPVTDANTVEKISKSIMQLENEMRKLGYGSPELLREITQRRVASIELNMNKRVVDAVKKAQETLNKVPTANRLSEESRIVRGEIDKVAGQVKAAERALWARVPKDLDIPIDRTRTAYGDIVAGLSKAEMVDIPAPLENSPIIKKKGLTSVSLKEMQGLRSKLLEVGRIARKEGHHNKARIANRMADAIIDDLDNVGGFEELKVAIGATKGYKTLFESGIVGKIRGFDKTGAPTIDPSITLDVSIGRGGARGAVDMGRVLPTQEAKNSAKRYLGKSFTDYALDSSGQINPNRSARWIKNNEDILDQFPDLRGQIIDADSAQQFALKTKATMDARKQAIRNPSVSTAARVTNTRNLYKEVGTILKSDNAVGMVNDLVAKANKDTTGKAREGLRAAFIEHILDSSTRGSYNELGEQTVSGRAILNFIKLNERPLGRVFSFEDMQKMKSVGRALSKAGDFERARATTPKIDMDDPASNVIQLLSKVGGAQIGRFLAGKTGGGTVQTPGILSKRVSDYTHGLNVNKANQMIIDAVISDDPSLLRALLLPIDKPNARVDSLIRFDQATNLWLLGAGRRLVDDETNRSTP